jgi:hypothetical protein
MVSYTDMLICHFMLMPLPKISGKKWIISVEMIGGEAATEIIFIKIYGRGVDNLIFTLYNNFMVVATIYSTVLQLYFTNIHRKNRCFLEV